MSQRLRESSRGVAPLVCAAILTLLANTALAGGKVTGSKAAESKPVPTSAAISPTERCAPFHRAANSRANAKVLRVAFTQLAHNSFLDEEITQKGEMLAAPPHFLRWEYQDEPRQTLIADGNAIWFQESANLVRKGELQNTHFPYLVQALFGDTTALSKVFEVRCDLPSAQGEILVTLDPREILAEVKQIRIILDETSSSYKVISFIDHYDQESRITLEKIEELPAAPEGVFVYQKPSPDTKVVGFDGEPIR